jgi:hypothetical protein
VKHVIMPLTAHHTTSGGKENVIMEIEEDAQEMRLMRRIKRRKCTDESRRMSSEVDAYL